MFCIKYYTVRLNLNKNNSLLQNQLSGGIFFELLMQSFVVLSSIMLVQ